jgi:hypothetical protein
MTFILRLGHSDAVPVRARASVRRRGWNRLAWSPPMSTPSIVCYDFPAVVRFLDSVALAMALQQNTALEWNRYDESKVLNAMYWVMAWKTPPGTVELKTDEKRVDVVRCDLLARFVGTWLDRVCEGPRAASQYLADKARLRDLANEGIQDALREAHVINSEIGGEVSRHGREAGGDSPLEHSGGDRGRGRRGGGSPLSPSRRRTASSVPS